MAHLVRRLLIFVAILATLGACAAPTLPKRPLSWSDQLPGMEQAAQNIDREAQLRRIMVYQTETTDATLDVTITFIRPSGHIIDVSQETWQGAPLHVQANDAETEAFRDGPRQQELIQQLPNVTIGPADALRITTAEATRRGLVRPGEQPSVFGKLSLGAQPTWDMEYTLLNAPMQELRVMIDAVTGAVLSVDQR